MFAPEPTIEGISRAAVRYTVRALILESIVWLFLEVSVQPTRPQRTNFEIFIREAWQQQQQQQQEGSPNRAFLQIRLSEIEFLVSYLPSVSVKPKAGKMDQRKEPPFCIILKED